MPLLQVPNVLGVPLIFCTTPFSHQAPGAVYQGRTARGRLVHKGVERIGDRLVLSGDTLYESGYFSVQSACFVARDGKRALLVGTL